MAEGNGRLEEHPHQITVIWMFKHINIIVELNPEIIELSCEWHASEARIRNLADVAPSI